MPAVVLLNLLLLTGLAHGGHVGDGGGHEGAPSPQDRIHYFTEKVRQSPKHYMAYARLAAAYLDQARVTHDPAALIKARQSAQQSLDIQSSLLGFQTMAAVCNYSHRFAEGLDWARRAAAASPEDTSVLAMQIESLLGLGREQETWSLLTSRPVQGDEPDFYLAATRGQMLIGQGKIPEGVAALEQAGRVAREQRNIELLAWTKMSAAGAYLDTGRPGDALPYLTDALNLNPRHIEIRLHQVEYLEARGQLPAALRLCESLCAESADPVLHARAMNIARRLGDTARAEQHFKAAEKACLAVLDAGEIYTLGTLASLYRDAGVHRERALELARRNLEYTREASAVELLADLSAE